MSDYSLALVSLLVGLIVQISAAVLATEVVLRKRPATGQSGFWLALACSALLLALQSVYALELALHTGLFDLRQALLTGTASALFAYAISRLRRGIHPPR